MIKIKVSYERPEQIREVLGLLAPVLRRYKLKKNQSGQYCKAYIEADISIRKDYREARSKPEGTGQGAGNE